jgi:hypothetical protein
VEAQVRLVWFEVVDVAEAVVVVDPALTLAARQSQLMVLVGLMAKCGSVPYARVCRWRLTEGTGAAAGDLRRTCCESSGAFPSSGIPSRSCRMSPISLVRVGGYIRVSAVRSCVDGDSLRVQVPLPCACVDLVPFFGCFAAENLYQGHSLDLL